MHNNYTVVEENSGTETLLLRNIIVSFVCMYLIARVYMCVLDSISVFVCVCVYVIGTAIVGVFLFLFESQSREHRVSRAQWSSGPSAETSRSDPWRCLLHGTMNWTDTDHMQLETFLAFSQSLRQIL